MYRQRASILRSILRPASLLCGLVALALAAAAQDVATPAATASVAAPAGDIGTAFSTRYAHFEPAAFDSIPGWNSDDARSSLEVFRISCKVLQRKPAWTQTCADLAAVDPADDAAARAFFQTHFHAYQVFNTDQSSDGLITGYYEPQLHGSRTRTQRFRYPVYATPRDLYELDSRTLSGAQSQWFRTDGQRLRAAAPGTPDAREYQLALGDDRPDLADKRYRVRIDGDRIVPYWNRQDIDNHGIDADVLAWVDNAWTLYSMQIQGSGRITLTDGSTLRVAYAEQNGQPFMPHVSGADRALVTSAITTRGLELAGGAPPSAGTESVADLIAQLKGGNSSATPPPAPTPGPAYHAPAAANGNTEVQSMVAALMGNGASATPGVAARPVSMPRPAAERQRARDPGVQDMIANLLGHASPASSTVTTAPRTGTSAAAPAAAVAGGSTGITDPSFVFFRRIDSVAPGPPGALGVPLTAGRSLAVDPRTTPLGAPVFVETSAPLGGGQLQRLMLAQDTGGAIRGSVRGDFFWGYGRQAGNLASAMNADGHMWLLLPRTLALGALSPAARTRGLGAAAVDCVIPDDESCVEASSP